MGMTRERIWYSFGNEHNPGDPFGRDSLVIEVDGRVRLDHFGGKIGRGRWTGTVVAPALDSFWSAIERSSFPEFPRLPVPAGGACYSLGVGAGYASKQSVSIYQGHASLPGYGEAFTILAAIVRQMSDPADASPPAAMKVRDVLRVDPRDPRFATPPSAGSVFLLACLSARRVTQSARRELLERHAANAADAVFGQAIAIARQAVDGEQRAADNDGWILSNIARSFDLTIEVPASPHRSAAAPGLDMLAYLTPPPEDPTMAWLTETATAVRPLLETSALEAAWHAGEAARLVAVCVGLASTLTALHSAAPDNEELRAATDELARDRAESVAALKERLEATSLPLVVAQASRLARPDEIAADVHAFLFATARAFDEKSAPPV